MNEKAPKTAAQLEAEKPAEERKPAGPSPAEQLVKLTQEVIAVKQENEMLRQSNQALTVTVRVLTKLVP